MTKPNRAYPLAISVNGELIAEIDGVAADLKESRSGVMRKSIRFGLDIVKAGGAADVLTLDGELSREVEVVAKQREENRNKVLLGAIRAGLYRLPPVQSSAPQSAAMDSMNHLRQVSVRGALGLDEPGGEDLVWSLLEPILMPRIVEAINARLVPLVAAEVAAQLEAASKGLKPAAGK